MANDIVPSNVQTLVDGWLKAEQEGERFPVPFDAAWVIAGYSRKDVGKRKIESYLEKDSDYSTELRNNGRGKPAEDIHLTCDAFKQLCMVSKTDRGAGNSAVFHRM